MRRIISILTVALIMAAMIVVIAVPAFAQGRDCGEFISSEGQAGRVGEVVRDEAGPELGPEISEDCSGAARPPDR
jgi:hypothetical protein